MFEIFKTSHFEEWLLSLRDRQAVARIQARIDRLSLGNSGDVKPVGNGISEMRIDYGAGYRIYFTRKGPIILLLLCGGDKTTQCADIQKAKMLASEWEGEQP
jgi:putative addiction module killer protein